ncbi:MAG: tRNA-guanine transglycosylase [Holosporaceae bacterium]|jgi:queuine tRNA-ribosyltransferase|nr:tRNA-guanine transglycosylase [Holosporaceae bacterium]
MYRNFKFDIISLCGKSRLGVLETPHGSVRTPAFVFCGIKASVKGVSPQQLQEAGTQIVLSNTYHLFSYPGSEHIKKHGSLHKFMRVFI